MQQEIKRARERLIIARLTMMLGRKMTIAFLGADEESFSTVMDMVICKAVFISQLEGRPLTAAKVAAYVGIPRPTAVRRLQLLVDAGLVHRDEAGKFTLPADRMNAPDALARVQTVINAIQRAAADLSKSDT